ncbi:MAG: CHAT domain-containing protein, partial [Saprospiraceae bacterium]
NNNLGRCFNLLGLINHKRKNYLEAFDNYQTSIESFPSDLYPHSSLAIGYENIADNYFSQKEYDQALNYYQRSLSYLSNQLNPLNTLEDNPIVYQISPTESNNAIRILGLKINALYYAYQEQKEKKYLEIALETSNTMDTLVHNFRLFNKSGEDKITLSETVLPYYENSILVAQELFRISQDTRYLTKAYQALLNIKGIVLLEEIKAKEVLYSFAPKAVIEKETNLREAIYRLEKILSIASETERAEIIQKHFEAKSKYEQYLKTIERGYPNYYAAKFDYQASNRLSEIQGKLADDMLIFDFLEGSQGLYLFGISNTQLNLELITDKNSIDSTIQQINQSLDLNAIHTKAAKLYSRLVKPTLTAHQKKFEHLTFIKSGFLHNLAFDLLRTDNQRYLIEEYKLCELYSAKQLLQEKKYGEKKFEYLGFAIDYQTLKDHQRHLQLPDDSIYLNQLNAVKGEVLHGKNLFNSSSYFNQQVSIQQLKEYLTRSSNIIHFSMHAISSPNSLQSGLIVYDQAQQLSIFNKNDIMAHRLDNDLTILSACKTGAGKKYKGEGVMSLARAFFNAGSQSVLVSTNSAADHSSQKIMSLLLDYIKEGKSKDEALQLAKLKYVAEAPPAYQHPKYWAYFSIIGNTDPIAFAAPDWTNYLVMIIACLMVLAGFLYYQRTKKLGTPASSMTTKASTIPK